MHAFGAYVGADAQATQGRASATTTNPSIYEARGSKKKDARGKLWPMLRHYTHRLLYSAHKNN